jgi:hypothetical protein
MAAQQGFLYEQNTYKALSSFGVKCLPPAGASSDKPDLTIVKDKKNYGVELKNQPTAAGSLVMQYYKGAWHFGPTDNNPEKEFLQSVGEGVDILKTMNKGQWKGLVPVLQYENNKKTYIGGKNEKQGYQIDIAKFGGQGAKDIYEIVPNKVIADYYNSKKCHYINIGTHGFFLLNKKDPLGLNKMLAKAKLPPIPDFAATSSAKTQIRVRCQYKSPGYQFAFTLQFGNVAKSPYNIAPVQGAALINKTLLKKSPLIAMLK